MKRILFLLLSLVIASNAAFARKVSGIVTSGEEKLSGVIVTDGQNFTQTKPNGKFKFEIKDDAQFVYIITPSGYAADWSSGVPAFYRAAEGVSKFTFDLKKLDGDGSMYNLIAVGDPQPRTDAHFEIFAGKPLDDLAATAQSLEGITIGFSLGDMCWDVLPLLDKWKGAITRTGIPFYPVVGNHDHDRDASGDLNGTAAYRAKMGPENYAFWVGNDMVIALDNIIYDAKRKYKEGYADHVLRFVKGLLKYVPMSADLYVAQHSPVLGRVETRTRIINATDLISMLRGHKVTFISGHNHVNDHFEFEKDITEQNVASICGAWWDTQHCKDGTPRGYKVFTKKDGKLSWYFKAEGREKDFQVEIFKPGQMPMHPNSVVANVWDWDPQWKVEWYEDGQYMGTMDRVTDLSPLYTQEINKAYEGKTISDYKKPAPAQHYFAATPSQYARKVMVTVESRFGKSWVYEIDMTDYVDVQAHRGGAGLMPENTIEAMKHCLDMGVNTLEMDFVLSGDGKVVVSHENYFHHRYTTRPDGSLVQKGDPKEYLYKMTYDQIAKYDVGLRPTETWPDKACMPAVKPLAEDLIAFVENYTKENGLSPVRYNIEIKSSQADGQSINWANYDKLADAIMRLLVKFHLDDRLVVQCFEVRTLNYIQPKYPEINFSYLISNKTELDFDGYMALLKFTPKWLSPHHELVNEELIAKCREKGMKIVPWTVDKPEDIKRMIDLKVDAIISNYPDRVLMQTRGY